jgi:hypothetical protein
MFRVLHHCCSLHVSFQVLLPVNLNVFFYSLFISPLRTGRMLKRNVFARDHLLIKEKSLSNAIKKKEEEEIKFRIKEEFLSNFVA